MAKKAEIIEFADNEEIPLNDIKKATEMFKQAAAQFSELNDIQLAVRSIEDVLVASNDIFSLCIYKDARYIINSNRNIIYFQTFGELKNKIREALN